MTISSDSLNVAGNEFNLTCTMTTVENLVSSALVTMQWIGSSNGLTESSSTTKSGVTYTGTLSFSPLLTSHGAEYTCQAMIIWVTSENGTEIIITVQSK